MQKIILLCLAPRLNIAQIDNIRKLLFPLITQPNKQIIMDLRRVDFMDCSAVGCIVSLDRIAHLHHSSIVLCNLTPHVKLLADILKLAHILAIDKPIGQKTSPFFVLKNDRYCLAKDERSFAPERRESKFIR